MNTNPASNALFFYGGFLIMVAIAAVSYDPVEGVIGFNARAKTALMSGGMTAGISILWAILLRFGYRWAHYAAMVTTTLFLAAFTWRGIVGWQEVAAGVTEKAYAATLISMMWVASLCLLSMLAVWLRRSRAAG